ncbi:apolipoprotein D-like [Ostrea edulis]|uniref:apolipoprotein D-like n=1 Tax=Ostrea edulis TaxID=37623 RepID=UPI0024AED90A|nr:apolipoprotein D-like [Ostrea edulis]
MNLAKALFGIALCFPAVYGQVYSPGFCQNIPNLMYFQLEPYLGTWYEYARFHLNELDGVTCAKSTYSLNTDNTIRVITTGIKRRAGEPVRLKGVGEVFDPINEPERGQLSYYSTAPVLPKGNYWVLDTDYSSFAVVYSCNQLEKYKVETAYILLREPVSPSRTLLQYIYSLLQSFGINTRNFIRTNFRSCGRPRRYRYLT